MSSSRPGRERLDLDLASSSSSKAFTSQNPHPEDPPLPHWSFGLGGAASRGPDHGGGTSPPFLSTQPKTQIKAAACARTRARAHAPSAAGASSPHQGAPRPRKRSRTRVPVRPGLTLDMRPHDPRLPLRDEDNLRHQERVTEKLTTLASAQETHRKALER